MSAPSYDWLAQLTPVQQKFLEDNYSALWDEYKTYGYSVMLYDYARDIDDVYDHVKSVHIVEKVDLPDRFEDKVKTFYKKQMEICQLKQIVVPIQDYHVILVTRDPRISSELTKSIKDVPVVVVNDLLTEDYKSKCSCVIFDDIERKIPLSVFENCELHALPYIRRTIAGWTKPVLEKDTENILLSFVERYRPCKVIR